MFKLFFGRLLMAIPQSLGAIRRFLAALGSMFDKLGESKAQAITQQAEDLVKWAEANHAQNVEWFMKMYPDLQALLKVWGKLPSFMYVVHNTMANQQTDLHTAATATQLAVNELKNP